MMTKSNSNENKKNESSNVQKFYKDACIFITGGSGFLGHLLIQKLIRHCPDLSRIYLLLRPKKGKSIEERFQTMLENTVFDKMKEEHPDFMNKIRLISGDLRHQDLGLEQDVKEILFEEVNIIFHLGATVRFDEKIGDAVLMNTKATKDLIKLAKDMKNLKAFVHCSTAYSNCNYDVIDEKFYDMPYTPDRVFDMIDSLNDEELECLTPRLISKWPNTYSFTKALGENVIREDGKGLPITIVRPAIVISTDSDPLDGWVNSMSGLVGLSYVAGYGLLRVMRADPSVTCHFIPGDYVINNLIVAGHYIGTTFNSDDQYTQTLNQIKSSDNIPIFNCTSDHKNYITWRTYQETCFKGLKWAPHDAIWYLVIVFHTNLYFISFLQFLLHTIPAHIIDFILRIRGKEERMVKIMTKVNYVSGLLSYFTLKDWIFLKQNNEALWNRLNTTDQELFKFTLENLNWENYFLENFGKGMYLYVSKGQEDKLPESQARYKRLKYLHYLILFTFYSVLGIFIYKIVNELFFTYCYPYIHS